jgi:hypothetical protein
MPGSGRLALPAGLAILVVRAPTGPPLVERAWRRHRNIASQNPVLDIWYKSKSLATPHRNLGLQAGLQA